LKKGWQLCPERGSGQQWRSKVVIQQWGLRMMSMRYGQRQTTAGPAHVGESVAFPDQAQADEERKILAEDSVEVRDVPFLQVGIKVDKSVAII
jgi:hypothetical protein